MPPGHWPPSIQPSAGWWPPGPGVPSASRLSPTAATSRRSPSSAWLFSEDGTPLHNYASYLGVADLAAAAVRADRQMERQDVLEQALSRLDGRVVLFAIPQLTNEARRASARLEQPLTWSARARSGLKRGSRAGTTANPICVVG
jgi:hypothetical protein